ncbi:MAG: extracellular solute-binding protein [Clostridiales bacterium]|jgi:putative aldouronate transport system substrate-binding protein|nr:extracellular solute-binding protein [Clostridiales bacterium]
MKRKLALLLACVFIIALFAGCGGKTSSGDNKTDAGTAPPDEQETDVIEESPYNFAKGNFETNEKGYPVEPYEYTLPISTTDEVLTYWTSTLLPQYLPEDGYGALDYAIKLNELTGINIEYQVVAYNTMGESFSTMLAADDLPDMMNYAIYYYPGSFKEAVEDEYFINIWDYRDYCPNYIYQATCDPEDTRTYETIFYEDNLIYAFYIMWTEKYQATGKVIRGDYLDKIGLKNTDLVTWDDWFEVFNRIKTELDIEYPWPLTNPIDVVGTYWTSPSFDTLGSVAMGGLPAVYVKDGQVCFGNMTERDLAYMKKMNEFYNAGIIDPNWANYGNSFDFSDKTAKGQTVIMDLHESEVPSASPTGIDPNCRWEPLNRPLLYEGQVLHLGGGKSRVDMGNTSISAKCENIPLAVTWCDFSYSPFGSFYVSYGPEGVLWEYDADGNITSTEFAINHEMGVSWAYMIYAVNSIIEHGLEDTTRKTKYPGGERILEVRRFWNTYDYDGAYEFPVGVRLTDEEREFVNTLAGDISTFISENYSLFLDNTKAFSEWDAYVAQLYDLGMQDIIDTYQTAYDRYLESKKN